MARKSNEAVPEAEATQTEVPSGGNAPVEVFRYRGIAAKVFANQSKEGGTWYNVAVDRTYKDGEEFKNTNSYSRDHLPVVMALLRQAYDFILQQEMEDRHS